MTKPIELSKESLIENFAESSLLFQKIFEK
jgi:hypothetical protein